MTKGVGANGFGDPGAAGDPTHDPCGAVPVQPPAVRAEEDRSCTVRRWPGRSPGRYASDDDSPHRESTRMITQGHRSFHDRHPVAPNICVVFADRSSAGGAHTMQFGAFPARPAPTARGGRARVRCANGRRHLARRPGWSAMGESGLSGGNAFCGPHRDSRTRRGAGHDRRASDRLPLHGSFTVRGFRTPGGRRAGPR
jgi:hypothetical protein